MSLTMARVARARSFVQRRTLVTASHPVYISTSVNPFFNLSFEDWLFRHAPKDLPILFLYRCSPSVIIGRNQNPWKEVNFSALTPEVSFVRRRSGGGTVYHDLGNTNFSVHTSRLDFDRRKTSQMIHRAILSLGSAYKISNNRAYHHGTMLISTELGDLRDILKVSGKDSMSSKGVESVRSPVNTLNQYHPNLQITHKQFCDAVVRQFAETHNYPLDTKPFLVGEMTPGVFSVNGAYMTRGMSELCSWEWLYGQTPEFVYTVHQDFAWGGLSVEIKCKHGIIRECIPTLKMADAASGVVQHISAAEIYQSFSSGHGRIQAVVQRVCESMKGEPYGAVSIPGVQRAVGSGGWSTAMTDEQQDLMVEGDIVEWLTTVAT